MQDDSPNVMYAKTDAGVKQVILTQSDPETARSLCQVDNRHRRICRDNLLIQEKTRICLGNDKVAAECDLIPMFSQRQFFALITKNIEIFPNDPNQFTHNFYSQNYKLPTEGYSTALYKAKLMNTICAITRPHFLLTDQAKQLKLPAYIDTSLLDLVMTAFARNIENNQDDEPFFETTINLSNNQAVQGSIQMNYYSVAGNAPYCYMLKLSDFELSIDGENLRDEFETIDQLINEDKYLKTLHKHHMVNDNDLMLMPQHSINAFELSRVIKMLFDRGYYYDMSFTVVGHNLSEITRPL
jgi:hypothetical protein